MSLFRSDPNVPPQQKFFHSNSVSVPIAVPSQPGYTAHYSVPFGPPVIHAEPEKTLAAAAVCQAEFDAQQSAHRVLPNTDTIDHHWFNIAGKTIVPEFLDLGECDSDPNYDNAEEMLMDEMDKAWEKANQQQLGKMEE